MNKIHTSLWNMTPLEINQAAYDLLHTLLERATINLISKITKVTRVTLYRWVDPERSLEEMDSKQAAWFITMCETSPKAILLLDHAPLSHPRMAHRITDTTDEVSTNEE